MRVIGLDVHRTFAQVAILENGMVKDHGRVAMDREAVLKFAGSLTKDDDVVIEATGNTAVIVRLITPYVRRVAIANPLQVRAIAWAKVKTDKIDAATLARLHAAQFLPEVWIPSESVELERRCIAERTQLVSQLTRLKTGSSLSSTPILSPDKARGSTANAGGCCLSNCIFPPIRCVWRFATMTKSFVSRAS
jgi:transposase